MLSVFCASINTHIITCIHCIQIVICTKVTDNSKTVYTHKTNTPNLCGILIVNPPLHNNLSTPKRNLCYAIDLNVII